MGRVQDGRSNVGVAARGTRKIQGVRTNDTSRPPCSAEQRSRVIANRISGIGAGTFVKGKVSYGFRRLGMENADDEQGRNREHELAARNPIFPDET